VRRANIPRDARELFEQAGHCCAGVGGQAKAVSRRFNLQPAGDAFDHSGTFAARRRSTVQEHENVGAERLDRDEIEQSLALDVTPASWPIGMGRDFLGTYDFFADALLLFERGVHDRGH
jgi:hypothetical protein